MPPPTVKVIGERPGASLWDRFDRLQRTVGMLRPERRGLRRVYRFDTFEQFEDWKWSQQTHPDRPDEPTS